MSISTTALAKPGLKNLDRARGVWASPFRLYDSPKVSRKHAFITVDAWRNDQERERLLKWNLTALIYMRVDAGKKLFIEVGYAGDYYWFIAE